MSACSHENKIVLLDSVNQEPVRFDVALPMPDIGSNKGMISVLGSKRLLCLQLINNSIESVNILTALASPF